MRTPRNPLLTLSALAVFATACLFATTAVTVSSGDTLSEIAEANGVTISELVAWNELDDPDHIVVGQVLTLGSAESGGEPASETRHVVTAGETLSIIAARYGASVAALAEANGLADPNLIKEGETLRIDGPPSSSSDATTPPADAAEPAEVDDNGGDGEHTIQPGETLFSIAQRYGISVDTLVNANDLTDPDRIRSGARLRIPSVDVEPATDPKASEAETEPESAPQPDAEAEPAEAEAEPEADADSDPLADAAPEPAPSTPSSGASGSLTGAFERWAASYGVPQGLLEAVTWHASDWQPAVTGEDGRIGIGQLTAEQIDLVETRLLGLDLDPQSTSDGVRLVARYLRYLRDRTHTDREALIAYRQGLSSFLDDGPTVASEAFADAVLVIREQRR